MTFSVKSHAFHAGGALFQPDASLQEVDPEIAGIIANEKRRQVCGMLQGLCSTGLVWLAAVLSSLLFICRAHG
jgi:hypothetical protein